jgi:hypothetical protein
MTGSAFPLQALRTAACEITNLDTNPRRTLAGRDLAVELQDRPFRTISVTR